MSKLFIGIVVVAITIYLLAGIIVFLAPFLAIGAVLWIMWRGTVGSPRKLETRGSSNIVEVKTSAD